MKVLKNVLRYVHRTRHYVIKYGPGQSEPLKDMISGHSDFRQDGHLLDDQTAIAFCDASHGGERPMAGYVLFLGGGPVAWAAYRLPLTPLSSCESEYVGGTRAAINVNALRGILSFLGTEQKGPTTLFCDNKAAVQLSENNTSSKRMKHIATRIAFLREQVTAGILQLFHISTNGQVADIFTKPLGAHIYHTMRQTLLRGPMSTLV